MKYIPAEKLLADIERRKKQDVTFRERSILIDIETAITSLQQEQPFPRWIHANYSDKPEIRYSPSGEPYLQSGSYMIWLSDLDTLPKDGTDLNNLTQEQPDKYETALEKAREWMPNVNQGGHAILIDIFPELGEVLDPRYGGRKQEQPEVDLEKEIEEELDRNWKGHYIEHRRFVESAKYFYKLGLNARKEDTK